MTKFRFKPIKVIVTGTSKGIGKGIYDWFNRREFFTNLQALSGSSRTEGNPISLEKAQAFLDQYRDYDIFVNNAPLHYVNMVLTEYFHRAWRNQPEKFIINMSSIASRIGNQDSALYAGMKAGMSHQSLTLGSKATWPRIFVMEPGLVHTDMARHLITGKALTVEDVVAVLALYFQLYDTNPDVHIRALPFHHGENRLYMA